MQPHRWSAEADAAPTFATPDDAPPRRADAYPRLLERCGGGMSAEVWRAIDADGTAIALKILRPERRRDAVAQAWIAREHEVLRAAAHEHVVATRGLRVVAGAAALALEYLDGGDLVPLLGAPARHWLGAARDVLAALLHTHAVGFVHRDVKARNVLLDGEGRARLIDFASALPIGAHATRGGTTAGYARPAAGGAASVRDDARAFAALVHELATGRLPAAAPNGSRALAPGPLASLERLALRTLAADGAAPGGLLAFADVIESALAASA
jgi:serine/threonine protein kinase